MSFRPLHDRVVIRRLDADEKTKGGIIIPDTVKEKPQEGEVVAVGPGSRDNASFRRSIEEGRPGAVRQMVRDRGEDRRRRPADRQRNPTFSAWSPRAAQGDAQN